jgi:hypothetical protein
MALSTTIQTLVPPAKKFNKSWWSMRLGEYLRSVDVSQTRFAALIGVRQATTICRYILGEQVPSVPIVVKIRDLSGGAVGLDDWVPERQSVPAKAGTPGRGNSITARRRTTALGAGRAPLAA